MSQQAPYAHITYAQARQQIANRLYDAGKVFFADAEIGLYLAESLHTWNALTSYWRGDFTFTPQPNVTWYDLTNTGLAGVSGQMPNTLRPFKLHDTDLYTLIQYHLLEPVSWNPWVGNSSQFTADDLLNAVGRRRDEVLSTSAPTVTRRVVPAVSGRITLPDSVIDVRRMAYIPALVPGTGYGVGFYGAGPYGGALVGGASVMWPDDAWAEQAYDKFYTLNPPGSPAPPGNVGTPLIYLMSTQPPLSFDTDRGPSFGGQYELLTIEVQPQLSFTVPSLLMVPDDWAWTIKWGALADLLGRESQAQDPLRAQYAEQRYRMALTLLDSASSLLAIRMNNVALQIDSVREADLFTTSWQNQSPGAPQSAFHAGLNLLALAPVPDAGAYSAMATVVESAPIPVADGDFVQVGRDDLDAVVDYAVHVAMFKCGGAEFTSTMPLLKRFLTQAQIYNAKLAELGEYTTPLYALGSREKSMAPVMATPLENTNA